MTYSNPQLKYTLPLNEFLTRPPAEPGPERVARALLKLAKKIYPTRASQRSSSIKYNLAKAYVLDLGSWKTHSSSRSTGDPHLTESDKELRHKLKHATELETRPPNEQSDWLSIQAAKQTLN